ncbi:MAG: type IV pilus secretin PilQ [Thermodesulfobacteriota bacterium]|nr:type IV pilus secretin PilQ [Thermodesulfobacteriota bacterium]
MISIVRNKLLGMCSLLLLATVSLTGICFAQPTSNMVTVSAVEIGSTEVVLNTDSQELVFATYTLGAPPRLVVDLANALPEFSERSFAISDGYSRMRVGLYADKTRFVFDAANGLLPDARVVQQGANLVIAWGAADSKIAVGAVDASTIESGAPVSVESIDFDANDGVSVFKVALSSDAQLISPSVDGDIIRFGVKDAVIPRSLRRVVDASVFPSAVLQITPYSTIVAGERRVMFAARMKGAVEYNVNLSNNDLVFRVVDGPFAEAAAEKIGSVVIPVDRVEKRSDVIAYEDHVAQVIESLRSDEVVDTNSPQSDINFADDTVQQYTGELVNMVFENAELRQVMLFLGEIEHKNMIIPDSVKGRISLKLVDVPWDQALDLVLEIGQLGKKEEGNVIQILPLEKLLAMESAKLAAETAKLQAKREHLVLEELHIEFITINHMALDEVVGFITGASEKSNKEEKNTKKGGGFSTEESAKNDVGSVAVGLLSERGAVWAVPSTKQVMIRDTLSNIEQITELIQTIDKQKKQVMIEARIVEASTGDSLDLGINWGLGYLNDDTGSIGIEHADNGGLSLGGSFIADAATGIPGMTTNLTFGRLGFDNFVLDLKLAALEASNMVRIVSSPKVLTLDGEEAEISDGVQIPYKTSSDDGPVTEFQDATLSLTVTPEIKPNGSIILEIEATNSRPGATYSDGTGIDEKSVETILMLNSGETTVIGGVYIDSTTNTDEGVPFVKDLPLLGHLFKSTRTNSSRRELLVFITPSIVE